MTEPTLTAKSPAEARADVAFLKRMALAGRGEPAPALILMAVFGLAFGLVFLGFYVQLITAQGPQPFVRSGPWAWFNQSAIPAAGLAFLVALSWTGWRSFARDRRPLNRGALAAWSGAFCGLVISVTAVRIFTRFEPGTDAVYGVYLIPPIMLVLWGVAWWTTAIVSRRPWLIGVALASWAMAVAAAWAGNSLTLMAVAAVSLLGLAFAPAVILMVRQHA